MKKLLLVSTILGFAAIPLAGQADARGCIKGAIVGGIVGHFAGHHGGLGAAAGCAYGVHRQNRQDGNQGRSSYDQRGEDGQRNEHDRY